jgi:hypothetical protein
MVDLHIHVDAHAAWNDGLEQIRSAPAFAHKQEHGGVPARGAKQ